VRPTAAVGLAALLGAALVAALRRRFVVVDVEGGSMEPTVGFSDRLVVRRVGPRALRVGDIVVLERPYRDAPGAPWAWRPVGPGRHWLIKRLAALPGDPAPSGVRAADVVPAAAVAVLGDNRDASIDSREFGFVPVERVLGVAVRRFGQDGPVTAANRSAASRRASPFRPA
jgi:signal peptidase I